MQAATTLFMALTTFWPASKSCSWQSRESNVGLRILTHVTNCDEEMAPFLAVMITESCRDGSLEFDATFFACFINEVVANATALAEFSRSS